MSCKTAKKFVPFKTAKELKPCPFCGGEAEEENTRGSWEGYGLRTVYCQKCSASTKLEDWGKRVI